MSDTNSSQPIPPLEPVALLFRQALALHQKGKFREAQSMYEQVLKIQPHDFNTLQLLGALSAQTKQYKQAVDFLSKALEINPNHAESYNNRGVAFKRLGSWDKALSNYEKAIELKPNYDYLLGELQHVKMQICKWDDFDNQQELIVEKIKVGCTSSAPFPLLALSDIPPIHRLCAQIYTQTKYPLNNMLGAIPKHIKEEKILVGYFSADFKDHAVAYLTAELFEIHDRTRFEIIAFSLQGAKPNDMVRQRLTKAFDQFIDVSNKSDQEVAQLARDLKIDIAVDLGGFTANSRTGIFSYRAAPIQVNYLGFPGTMGAEYMDYIIADKVLIPKASQVHYAEKVVYLPDTYMVDDTKRQPSTKVFSRSECHLPADGFIFCSLNNSYKFNKATITTWANILLSVKDSVLWIASHHEFFKNNLLNEFSKLHISPERIIFASRIDLMSDYLARYQLADLFLDTSPYNAHTTAVDALKAGLPVLTLMGDSFASRVAASVLNAIGLPELITTTEKDYEDLAIELATNPEKLSAIKQKLTDNRLSTPLFNTPLFTKNLEAAYTQIMERYWGDLAPEHIEVV